MKAVYFCPDMKGFVSYQVAKNHVTKVSDHRENNGEFLEDKFKFRKPGAGMIFKASIDFGVDLTKSWMIGDRDKDEKAAMPTASCANAANINFMDAETWRMRFTPGMYEIRTATSQQIEFLEGINLN